MSENESSEIKELAIALARMEERQKNISAMLETSLSRYADLVNRVNALEVLKHRMLGMVAVCGFLFTIGWEIIKSKFLSKP